MLIIPFQVVVTSISLLFNQSFLGNEVLVSIFFELPSNILFNAALVITLYHLNMMKPLSFWRVWIYASYYLPKLLLATLVSFFFIGFGFLLFIIPGIIIAVSLVFTNFILVMEGKSVLSSIAESQQRTLSFFKPLLFVLMAQFLVGVLIYMIFSPYTGTPFSSSWGFHILISLVNSYILVFFTIVLFRFYVLQSEQTKEKS